MQYMTQNELDICADQSDICTQQRKHHHEGGHGDDKISERIERGAWSILEKQR